MSNNILYNKPFKTYDEQIRLLTSRNVEIDDYDFAKNALSSFSSVFHALYRAGGVNDIGSLRAIQLVRGGKPIATIDVYDFIKPGTDNFIPGTNFKDLYTLHIIDSNLNNIILKNILFVERFLKNEIIISGFTELRGIYRCL